MNRWIKMGAIVLLAGLQARSVTLPGLRTNGRFLEAPTGERVVLMGMDHETVWLDLTGKQFPELAKTGASAVRMAWATHANSSSNSLATAADQLDVAIAACIKQDMIPIPEFHDATGNWSGLSSLVDAWTSPEYVKVIQKHEQYLIVNIGNEVGDYTVTDAQYLAGYTSAVQRMRRAGIRVPLLIDGDNWGQNYQAISDEALAIIAADSLHNTMFSVHMYWTVSGNGNSKANVITKIQNSLNDAVTKGIPLIVGEFGEAFTSNGTVNPGDSIPFRNIMAECNKRQIGWLAWSWGGNSPQTDLNMSSDGTYAGLQKWGLEAMVTDPNSVKNNAVRPKYITQNVASGVFPSTTTTHSGTSTALRAAERGATPEALAVPGGIQANGLDGIREIRIRDASGRLLASARPEGSSIRIPMNERGMLLLSYENEQGVVSSSKLVRP
jgi:mannan endo-1,4-beta-mannosidase